MQRRQQGDTRAVVVERVIVRRRDSGFTVLEVAPESGGARFVAAGVIPLEVVPGESLLLEGFFEEHPRFGRRFRVASAQPRSPATEEGIRRYLASGRVPGIGPKLAERLVARFGADSLRILEEEPERVGEVPGVGPKKLAELRRSFQEGREQREALVFLQGLGLGPRMAQETWRRLGGQVVGIVKTDPYSLCELVTGVGFVTADKIAASLGITGEDPARLAAGLRHVLRGALEQGHTCLETPELLQRVVGLLDAAESRVIEVLEREVGEDRLRSVVPRLPEFVDSPVPRVYLPVLLETEREATRRLLRLLEASRPAPPRGHEPFLRVGHQKLVPEQEQAVALLLASKVSLLTGGPGVGKTTVLRAVVAAYRGAGYEVALASPTGRAARRLAEATEFEARTLHRLFGFVPGIEAVSSKGLLAAQVLIIDETSMLDLPLLLRVLRKLRETTILVLVGDPDQLPSVGPGRVLGDLLESLRIPTARLKTVHRQDSSGLIVENAHRILHGEMPHLPEKGAGSDFFFIQRDDPEEGAALIEELFLKRLPAHYGVDPRSDIQVLSPMYRGPAGVNALNGRLQEALNGDAPVLSHGSKVLRAGDRVIQMRNDYERELMNGDLGLILQVDQERSRLIVSFDGREVRVDGSALDALEVAYAMTVHKAQGGEFPVVLLPLFTDHMLMLKRNVIYTAVTRARDLMVVVGTEKALRMAVRDDRLLRRSGGFLDLLRGHALESVSPVQKN